MLPAWLVLAVLVPGVTAAPAPAPPFDAQPAPIWSSATARVADWVVASRDNGALPFIIVDKNSASMVVFDSDGNPLGEAAVLVGIAVGDEATPGVGSKNLAEIGPAEKTTPAGRFRARYGLAAGRQKILWVDYATSVAIHPIPPKADRREQRRTRMLSPSPEDNRITFGCINVTPAFYRNRLRPFFRKKGGYVYVVPDTRPLEAVFPRLRVHELTVGKAP